MRNAVFLSTGLGNALLLIPLLKELKSRGEVIAFCTSPYFPEQVFEGFADPPVDEFVVMRTPWQAAKAALRFKRKIDGMYLDRFSSTAKVFSFSRLVADRIHCVAVPDNLSAKAKKTIEQMPPMVGDHEATRYLKLAQPEFTNADLSESLFEMKPSRPTLVAESTKKYFTLQPGSGGNAAPWKNLPTEIWAGVAERLLETEPDARLILLGDDSETGMSDAFPEHPRIEAAFGTLDLRDLPALIDGAEMHLGGDSFLMHLAGCVQTPTFTVWGGSDPNMYGWNRFAPARHGMAYTAEPCAPCSRWLDPNTSRVTDPAECPDFRCLRGFTSQGLFDSIRQFRTTLAGD